MALQEREAITDRVLLIKSLGVLAVVVAAFVLHPFFFSSRRRHTRSLCDWSSDVRSSDLLAMLVPETLSPRDLQRRIAATANSARRSEERSGGKECRSRGSPKHEQKEQ